MPRQLWRCGRFELELAGQPPRRPLLMGVVNLTPDSFSDGGQFLDPQQGLAHARRLIDDGADLLDLGAESTRPGALAVTVREELARLQAVVPVLLNCGRPISIDTRKPEVMRAMVAAGADLINDVSGFADPEAIDAVARGRVGVCVMHMQGEPSTMQAAPAYKDVVTEVREVLAARCEALRSAGVDANRIVIDPGIGFGKTVGHNLELLARLPELGALGYPVLVGLSRKSLIGALTGRPVAGRLAGSLAGMLAAACRGASVLRVHDVAESRDALTVWQAIASGHTVV